MVKRKQYTIIGTILVTTLACISNVCAGEFTFNPLLTISEEYTDNVHETTEKQTDYITRVLPGFTAVYRAPVIDLNLNYAFDYRYYAKGNKNDEITHNADAKGLVKLIDEFLFLEFSDTYHRVSLDINRTTTNDNLSNNQTDQNVGVVSPYIVLRPSKILTFKTGYRYRNTWYKSQLATDRQAHIGFLDTAYEITPNLSTLASYAFTRELYTGNALSRHEAYVGPRYEYADKSFVFAQGGAMITSYDHDRDRTEYPSWKAGLTHTFDTVIATIETDVVFSEDPLSTATLNTSYRGNITRNFSKGTFALLASYNELKDTDIDKLQTKRYTGGFASSVELIQDLHGAFGFTYEYLYDNRQDAITRRYYIDNTITYQLSKYFTMGVGYHFADCSSAKIDINNYRVNRVIMEFKLTI